MVNTNVVENYGWGAAVPPPSCNYIVPAVLNWIEKISAVRILDLGSGNGHLCGQLVQAGYTAVGMEYDKVGVEISRKSYPNISFYNYGVQDAAAHLIAEENGSLFDAVVSTEVIEHLFSPHLLPQYAFNILSDDGCLIISTPYHGYLKNLLLSIFAKWDSHHSVSIHGGHIKFWSKKTLSCLLTENGFDVVAFQGVGRIPYVWKSMILVARKRSDDLK
jgi:2-polyprenyl-3-methyl-5-hydroxy-6-metoxy-1,4-benzoquinol methylase